MITPIRKIPSAIKTARKEGLRELGRRTAAYYAPSDETESETEPHIKMLQQRENLTIAEVGVWRGENSQRLCELLDVERIYLIDPYLEYEEYNEPKSDREKLSGAKEEAHNRLKNYPCTVWIEEFSDDAITQIDRELDYVYIDGNHSYEYVKTDIENYYELLADEGIIAGDDIHFTGVAQAVTEFSVANDLQPHFERNTPDWYFIKNRKTDPSTEYKHTPKDVYETIS